MKDLTKVPDNVIQKMGGEAYTQPLKHKEEKVGPIYIGIKLVDAYVVPNGTNTPTLVDFIPR